MTFKVYSDKKYNVSIKVSKNVFEHISVPKPVYDYILQLENAVRDDTGYVNCNLRKAYPGRFN